MFWDLQPHRDFLIWPKRLSRDLRNMSLSLVFVFRGQPQTLIVVPDYQRQYTSTSCVMFQAVSMLHSGFRVERWEEAGNESSRRVCIGSCACQIGREYQSVCIVAVCCANVWVAERRWGGDEEYLPVLCETVCNHFPDKSECLASVLLKPYWLQASAYLDVLSERWHCRFITAVHEETAAQE